MKEIPVTNCLECPHTKSPKTVFLDLTNRCNLNCPICINNTPAMGFLFEPPMEYFEKIFKHFSKIKPIPSIQLFGGEPTLRKDLFDIIKLAQSYNITVRVVTNGLRLADEEYCKQLLSTGIRLVLSYDGDNIDFYSHLRGREDTLAIKLQALENIKKYTQEKITIMFVLAKKYNEDRLDKLFKFVHDRSDFISAVDFIPLVPTWTKEEFPNIETEQTTPEDVETAIDKAFPSAKVEFIPAGVMESNFFLGFFKIKNIPFAGVHEDCERIALLVSDGKSYFPLSTFLKKPLLKAIRDMQKEEKSIRKKLDSITNSKIGPVLEKVRMKRTVEKIIVFNVLKNLLFKNANINIILDAKGPKAFAKMIKIIIGIISGQKMQVILTKHTRFQNTLRLLLVPFTGNEMIKGERLQKCAAGFAYIDHSENKIKTIPTCSWSLYKSEIMKKITDHYTSTNLSEKSV